MHIILKSYSQTSARNCALFEADKVGLNVLPTINSQLSAHCNQGIPNVDTECSLISHIA